ncbi:hypothetical protein VNO77_19621 [Canavalia gladiata]|uniref:Uncharacterized protein n=1 Tax=Canavalia gladiata TaxID=3824 RepID=A0AAN9LMV8_CANGL
MNENNSAAHHDGLDVITWLISERHDLTSTYPFLSTEAQEKENLQDACNEEMSSIRRLHEAFERQVER